MKRRDFLIGTAGVVGAAGAAMAQAPTAPAPAAGQGRGGRGGAAGGRGGGRGGGANIPAEKRARVSLMTLNYNSILKFPWTANPDEAHYMSILDLPQYYQDTYGVSNIEFQHNHLYRSQGGGEPDPVFLKEMRAKLDAAKVTATQINIEIGTMARVPMGAPEGTPAQALTGDVRATWLATGKKWVDWAQILGVKRLMLNQGTLNEDTKAGVISLWKELQDFARPSGIMISAETRGGGGGGRGAAPADGAAPAPPPRPAWMLLEECIEAAGGYSNIDIGGAGAPSQEALHAAIKGMFKTTANNMHIKSSPNWSIGKAVAYTESLGYKGTYSIEVNGDPAIRIVFNEIISNLA